MLRANPERHEELGRFQAIERHADIRQHQAVEAGRPFEQLQDAGMPTPKLAKIVR